MNRENVTKFIAAHGKNFASDKLPAIKRTLESADDARLEELMALNFKNPTTTLIFAIFLGTLGVDRFYLGNIGMGVFKLLTCGFFTIGYFIDLFTAMKRTSDANQRMLELAI
ncbi:MAG: TM2 domain-containing protein [Bacteroidales bacterium]|nr:TM2 domain-containing protein [Bacteroidales bacterium]